MTSAPSKLDLTPDQIRKLGRKFIAELTGDAKAFCQDGPNASMPGPCPDKKADAAAPEKVRDNWLAKAKQVPAKVMAKARETVAAKYKQFEGRYGKKYAVAIMAAGLAGVPIPLPLASVATAAPVIAVAELHRRLAGAHAECFSEGSSLHGVEIFAAGTHRGKKYTEADLDDMVRNFKKFSTGPKALVRVPTVCGHEETQEFLERSDLPSLAWPDRIYRKGSVLFADYDDIAPKVKRLLKNKAYRTVSSEVYDEPPEGVPGSGKMLRRIAFLGGDIPQIKTLDEIADITEHSEDQRFAPFRAVTLKLADVVKRPAVGTYFCFSEVRSMSPEEILAKLGEMGVDTEALKGCAPEALAEMLRVLEDQHDQHDDDDEDFDEMPDEPEDVPEDKKEEYAEQAKRYAEWSKKHSERSKKYMEKYCGKMDDASPVSSATPNDITPPPQFDDPKPGAPMPTKITTTHQYRELEAIIEKVIGKKIATALKPVEQKVQRIDKFAEDRIAAEKKATIKARLDALCDQGKVMPAERDAGLDDAIYTLDASTVRKFNEAGKTVSTTAFDHFFKVLESREARKFGEGVKGGPVDINDEKAKVEKFYETNRDGFSIAGITKEKYWETYQKAPEKEKRKMVGAA